MAFKCAQNQLCGLNAKNIRCRVECKNRNVRGDFRHQCKVPTRLVDCLGNVALCLLLTLVHLCKASERCIAGMFGESGV